MDINLLNQDQLQHAIDSASEGKAWHWKRTYVLQVDDKVYSLALNVFERIKKIFFTIIGKDLFNEIFPNKTVKIIDNTETSTFSFVDLTEDIQEVVTKTPQFSNYSFDNDPSVKLTDLSVRPSNLFYDALLGKGKTTMPGSGELFSFINGNPQVRETILGRDDDDIIEFNANRGVTIYKRQSTSVTKDKTCQLNALLGDNTFRISAKELKTILNGQNIILSPLISKKFYLGLKESLRNAKHVTLPGSERDMYTMERLKKESSPIRDFLLQVEQDPEKYQLDKSKFDDLMKLTLYQIGAMVIKADDYYCLVNNKYQLREREPNSNDHILLISACGIRGFHTNENQTNGNKKHENDFKIMKETFKTALTFIHDGVAIFPAVGMGVWQGDPDIYWRAFIEAIIESPTVIEHLFINPNHRPTPYGKYKNCKGEEFGIILKSYLKNRDIDTTNLKKIVNLYDQKTDLLLLAQNLKLAFPDKRVSLFNASDPDVTLGNHVGEYVNNLCHANTTEENYAAAGTSCLCFEDITGVNNDPSRVLSSD